MPHSELTDRAESVRPATYVAVVVLEAAIIFLLVIFGRLFS